MAHAPIWKSRPVFITSTFQDMQAERDHLRNQVFPALEEWLKSKRRHLEWIDLRVGVASAKAGDEAGRELLVLKVCLDEVRRSRPFLIALIGDRYGWVPPKERIAAAAKEAGFSAEVEDRSVTDLEIDFGVFHDEKQQRRSLFFLRGPLPYEKMRPEKAAEYSDACAKDQDAAKRRERLQALKIRIRAEYADRCFDYTAAWDEKGECVTGLEAWGRDVEAKIKQAIEDELAAEPEGATEQTPDDIERDALADFAEDRARDFIGRKKTLDDIEALFKSPAEEGAPWGLCITGEAGSGKSALFGALYQGLTGVKKEDAERVSGEQRDLYARLGKLDALVLAHAAGASPRATSVDAMLRRWIGELASFLKVDPGLEEKAGPNDVEAKFSSLLGRAALQRRVIVLVDALDQFEQTPQGRFVTWLPRLWPPNARFIAAAIPGEASEALSKRPGVTLMPIPALDLGEARHIAEAISARYHRKLEPLVLDALIGNDKRWGNPLWLVLAVEELNLLDADDFARARHDFEELARDDERIRALMCRMAEGFPADVPGLYRRSFEHAAELFGARLTQAFLGLIAVSRSGWRESDFREVLPKVSGEAWDELRFAQLRRSFRGQLRRRGAMEQWDFAHAQMRVAAKGWLGTQSDTPNEILHRTLGQHLLAQPKNDVVRRDECFFHLLAANDYNTAVDLYTDNCESPRLIENATEEMTCRLVVEQPTGGMENDEITGKLLTACGDDLSLRGALIHRFLVNLYPSIASRGTTSAAAKVIDISSEASQSLSEAYPSIPELRYLLALAKFLKSEILRTRGYTEFELLQESNTLMRELFETDPRNLMYAEGFALGTLEIAKHKRYVGEVNSAGILLQEAKELLVRICNERPDKRKECLGGLHDAELLLGEILRDRGEFEKSTAALTQSLQISEEMVHIVPSGQNLRAYAKSNLKLAQTYCSWAKNTSKSIFTFQRAWRRLNEAVKLSERGLVVFERLCADDPSNLRRRGELSLSYIIAGDIWTDLLKFQNAKVFYSKSLRLRQSLLSADQSNFDNHDGVAECYERLVWVLAKLKEWEQAKYAISEWQRISSCVASIDANNAKRQRRLYLALRARAMIYFELGDFVGSLNYVEQALDRARLMLGRFPELATSRADVADMMRIREGVVRRNNRLNRRERAGGAA